MVDTHFSALDWAAGSWQRPGTQADAPVLLLLHGLGASQEDMQAVAEFLDPQRHYHLLTLNAPRRAVTLNRGYVMPAWYDLLGLGPDAAEDRAGMQQIAQSLRGALAPVLRGRELILGGFSQGAALSLYLQLHASFAARAVLVFSGYLPLRQDTPPASSNAAPIFWGHGTRDEVLPLEYARWGEEILQRQGYEVTRRDYPMGHSIVPEEIAAAREFLAANTVRPT
ncbi:alpha/beta fold hydrolase [Acidithiobacillus sp. AMEEHan]|uniref:alpha/beta hydrolase n=1 Tax=Acidithiobacillus sp. AMEEHan TaxID=2994951 RepID=UPI0027E519AF|nr:alpha/beta fold hydrolase [Acidithiobacillus sp. AMEEHan]